MDSGNDQDIPPNIPQQTGSFFMDGLTFSPGSGTTTEIPLPEPTAEFKFLRVLGVGGMGVVFEAEEFRTGRRVALKIIAPRLSMSEDAVIRFEQEARSSASLSHPNCVFVYGAYRVGASPAIAMELMHGDTLDDRIKSEGDISVEQAVTWTNEILDGLSAAHDAGLIHRDIKPSNIFLAENDEVKIGDFGLTRSTQSDLSLTQSGMFLGSPLYASPEQVRGQELDSRSDIYSVGATLYALLSGKAPHNSTSIGDLFARIATEEPTRLREFREDIPHDLEKIVRKALAKTPKGRFEDCAAFKEALLPFSRKSGATPRLPFRFIAYFVDLFVYIVFFALFEALWQRYVVKTEDIFIGSNSLHGAIAAEIIHYLHLGVFEGLTGASLGKRLTGLRVVTKSGDRPGLGRGFLRFVILEFTSLLVFMGMKSTLWSFGWYIVLLATMRRRNGMRGLHEFGSGTQVIEIKERFVSKAKDEVLLDPIRRENNEIVRKCGHYDLQSKLADIEGGILWLGRDERLDRDIWVTEGCHVTPPEPTAYHLQYLDRIEDTHAHHLVFESPGGASLAEYRDTHAGLPWHAARQVLIGLVKILLSNDNIDSISRLWVDRKGNLRSLPFRIGGIEDRDGLTLKQNVCCIVFGLESPKSALPEDIPDDARPVVLELLKVKLKQSRLSEIHDILVASDSRPRSIGHSIRFMQMLFSSFLPVLVAISWINTSPERLEQLDFERGEQIFASIAVASVVLIPAMIFALACRGSLGFLMFGIKVVNNHAHRVSRRKCLLRATILWLPLAAIMVASQYAVPHLSMSLRQVASWGLFSLWCLGGAYALWRPTRSFADWIIGTHLVR